MTNNTIIPHDHHHRLRPHHQEMEDQLQRLQALGVKKPPQAAKRQARRRTHTSRPYQERLLNMAEARREIVTALKIHRATTTSTRQHHQQSTHHHHHHHHEPSPLHRQPPPFSAQLQQQQEEASLPHTTTTMSYAAADSSSFDPLLNSPPAHSWIAAGGSSYWSPVVPILRRLPCDLITPSELPPTAAMGGLELEQDQYYQRGLECLVRSLPAQPLGLNLSFQGFGVSVDDDDDGASNSKDDDCDDLLVGLPSTTTQPSPPPAVETATAHAYGGHGYGSPAPLSAATDAENNHSVIDAPSVAAAAEFVPAVLLEDGGEMTMAQASSAGGEMQGVAEWSELAAAADVAAWWSKIFGSVESGQQHAEEDMAAAEPGLPAWRLCGGGDVGVVVGDQQQGAANVVGTTVMHQVDDDSDVYSSCYEEGRRRSRSDDGEHEDVVTLPCMDGIGDDTEGWDGEWFSNALEP